MSHALRSSLALVIFHLAVACTATPLEGGDTWDGEEGERDTGQPLATNPELCVNEFMASNSLTIEDDHDSYPDWVELYNLSDGVVLLDGYSITDDLEDPRKHVLAGGLTVDPGGFILLFADGEPYKGPDHLDFKLAKAGEEIGLYRPDGTPLDRLVYDPQVTDWSAARLPDAGPDWHIVDSPTPGYSNEG